MSKSHAPNSNSVEVSTSVSLKRLKEIITTRCILRGEKQWLVSPGGKDNRWQIDLRQALLDPESLNLLTDLFWDRFAGHLPFQIAGLEIAAIPLVIALLLKARSRGLTVNGFIIRKERKRYGTGKVIEGYLNDDPILVVDDIMNSGSSLERVRVALGELGRTISSIFVIINFRSQNGRTWLSKHGLEVSSLFTLDDFRLSSSRQQARPYNTFKNIWNFKSPKPNHFHVVPKSAPVVAGDKVLFGSDCGTLWALATLSGEVIWRFQIWHPGRKGIWSRAAIYDERVFFGAYDGNFYCLSLADGHQIWCQYDADWIGSSPVLSANDGFLWVGLEYERPRGRGSVVALNLEDGRKVWEFPVSGYAHGTPAHSAKYGAVAIGTNDHAVYMLDAFTGELRWRFVTKGAVKEQPTFDENRDLLYVTGFDGLIRALDISSGSQVWAISTPNIIYSAPLIVGPKLLVTATDKRLHVIDLELRKHKTLDLGSKSLSTPVLIEGNVFFGTNGGLIWEFEPITETLVGRHQLPDAVTNRLAWCPQSKLIFALTYMNQIFAFQRSNLS
jgi:orotate phosphoribosyltransferase